VPALAEPIVLHLDRDLLEAHDVAEVRCALDEAHRVTVHAPSWSVAIRCGSVVSIEIETEAGVSVAERMAALGSSGAWALLDALGLGLDESGVARLSGLLARRSRTAALPFPVPPPPKKSVSDQRP
jgi:hypothetical protein